MSFNGAAYRKKNIEKKRVYDKVRYQDPKVKAAAIARSKTPETIAYKKDYFSRPATLETQKAWRHSEAQRQRGIIVLEHIDREVLKKMYNGKDAYTGEPLPEKFHIDHMLPVSAYKKIGKKCPHSYGNCVPTVPRVNLQKHDRTPLEFLWNNGEPCYWELEVQNV